MVNQRKTVAEPESTQPSVDQRSLRAADHSGTAAESASSEKKAVDNPENNEPEKELFNPFYNYHKRKFPIWQRLVALISLSALAMVVGAMVGYGLLGHSNPFAVFNWHTWQHIIDFVKKD
ncbi:DNA-directed RNA polymerase subunit beta [Terrilactibacillus sp. S3-3]|nr:DNA-directed RNA polymerase subunit beta [Terrilactibacillus sp. S3-3]